MTAERLLVPVSRSATIRATVEYVVDRVCATATPDDPALLRFVYVHSPEAIEPSAGGSPGWERSQREADELLDRVRFWIEEDAGPNLDSLVIETANVGTDEYIFSPDDVARVLRADAAENGINRIVVDPEYDPGVGAPFLRPLEVELAREPGLNVDEAPVEPRTRRAPLLGRGTPLTIGSLFGISFVFYQVLAGAFTFFDIVTGAVSATIVAVALSRVTFSRDPSLRSPLRVLRLGVYTVYLVYEIIKANIQVARVILHPRLPIDPRMTRIRPAVWGGLPVTTLANSITLTPGTLSVRVTGQTLLVHTLVPAARNDLFDGGLERAVRYVFYGRRGMRLESPRARGDTELLQRPPSAGAVDTVDNSVARTDEPGGDDE